MKPISACEFPADIERVYRRARRLEWITVAYVASAATFLYIAMGGSQAMRASFFEDVVSAVPAVAFLIGGAIVRRKPTHVFPYGTHRATSIGHLVAALALCVMGLFLFIESAAKFLSNEKTTIGGVAVFGTMIWAGWPMLLAILYTSIPSFFLGRLKLKLAPLLHDKILYADAKMMKADWMAEGATAVGVIGAGLGYWWIDPLAAAVISVDIVKDGATNLYVAVSDLMDRRPEKTDRSGWESLPERVCDLLGGLDWITSAQVRMRDEGHVFLGEAFVVPQPGTEGLVEKIQDALRQAKALDWRISELVIMPVDRLPEEGG